MNPFDNFSHPQLFQMDDKTLEDMLIEAWGMKEMSFIQICAEIDTPQRQLSFFKNLRHPLTGKLLEFPIPHSISIQKQHQPHITNDDMKESLKLNSNFNLDYFSGGLQSYESRAIAPKQSMTLKK